MRRSELCGIKKLQRDMDTLLTPYQKGPLRLQNHLVMAPMTRSRAIGNIPNALMVDYYGQRSAAGLVVTEGTAPMSDGLGYPRIPGIFTDEQVEGWRGVTEAIHRGGAKTFMQLMHTGRIAHQDNLPAGSEVLAPSAITAAGQIFTDSEGLQDHTPPRAMTVAEVQQAIAGHARAAKLAVKAGFDGVELHGANGYLVEQFLNPHTNYRTDAYGGSIENRARFAVETVRAMVAAVGPGRVGIRLSPFGTVNDQSAYGEEEVIRAYTYLAEEMDKMGIAYLHFSVSPAAPQRVYQLMREAFGGTIIQSNGLTPETAREALEGYADLVAFGRSFLATPDLVERIRHGAPFNALDPNTLYTPGAHGYTDYPTLSEAAVSID